MREPSIHIKVKDLEKVLEAVIFTKEAPLAIDYTTLVKEIARRCRAYTVNNRSVIPSTQKLARDAERLVASGNMEVFKFQSLLNKVRATLKHLGITTIKTGNRDWLTLKEVAKNATEFCEAFKLKPEEGYVIYCKIGISKMQRYNISKFISLHAIICEQYRAEELIDKDLYPSITAKFHTLYCRAIIDRVGISANYMDDPINYAHFVEATSQCLSLAGKIEDYLKCQLEAFAWRSDYPQPIQLKGEKAINRFIAYAYKNNIQLKRVK